MIRTEVADRVCRITLDRPETRNALSSEMMRALSDALHAAETDPQVRAVVIGGAGPAFCAGHDLRELRGQNDERAAASLFAQCSALMLQIVRLPKPVIAQVHGMATAAGCQLVATCDLAIASRTARFATPGVRIGLFCTTPSVALTRAVGRKAALEMLFTGEPIGAERAREIGLINRVTALETLEAEVQALAGAIAASSPRTLALGKAAVQRQSEMALDAAYAFASDTMASNLLEPEAAEGIGAFLEKRAPRW